MPEQAPLWLLTQDCDSCYCSGLHPVGIYTDYAQAETEGRAMQRPVNIIRMLLDQPDFCTHHTENFCA